MKDINFLGIIDEIKDSNQIKLDKQTELMEKYENLSKSDRFIDIVMLQFAKEIEEKFRGVNFRIISRIKSKESFNNKLYNLLTSAKNEEEIKKIDIFDIIGISVVIEDVPEYLNTKDEDFNNQINEAIARRDETRSILEKNKVESIAYKKRLDEINKNLEKNNKVIEETKERLEKLSSENIEELDFLKDIIDHLENINEDYNIQIENNNRYEENVNKSLIRATEREVRENNACSNTLAKYIVQNFASLENLNKFNLKSVKGRFKNKREFNGYKATHDTFISTLDIEDKKIEITFELQGKSLGAYREADKGLASMYYRGRNIENESMIPKNKKMPNILNVSSEEERVKLLNELEYKLPKFRIYSPKHVKQKNDNKLSGCIHKFSQKENFIVYYSNELLGNKRLNIEPKKQEFDKTINDEIFKEDESYNFEI